MSANPNEPMVAEQLHEPKGISGDITVVQNRVVKWDEIQAGVL